MRAYTLKFVGDDRVVVHPLGLPPSWKQSDLTPEEEAAAVAAFESAGLKRNVVGHFTPDLQLIDTFPIR